MKKVVISQSNYIPWKGYFGNIKLYFVWSPSYHESHILQEGKKEFVDNLYRRIADVSSIKYFYYSNDSICYNKNLFYNSNHLNIRGAQLFSKKVCNMHLLDNYTQH